jgi:hypothetical protein
MKVVGNFVCIDCGKDTKRAGYHQKRCSLCAHKIRLARAGKARLEHRIKHPRVKIIKTFICIDCGKETQHTSSHQKRCSLCAPPGFYERRNKRTPRGRYIQFRARHVSKEDIPKTDLIWSCNFYMEIIKDGICHYCNGPLNSSGHGLDRVDNSLGHFCYNVIPCCKHCNTIKGDHFSYDEMMKLVPVIREIRRLRTVV